MRLLNTTNQTANKKIAQLVKPIDDIAISALVNRALYVSFTDTPDKLVDVLNASTFKIPSSDKLKPDYDRLVEESKSIKTPSNSKVGVSEYDEKHTVFTINKKQAENPSLRYMIPINPELMYGVGQNLIEALSSNNVPAQVVVQNPETRALTKADRISILVDNDSREAAEEVIQKVRKGSVSSFKDSERPVSHIHTSNIKNVFVEPIIQSGKNYEEQLASSIIDVKQAFNYLYGLTRRYPRRQIDTKEGLSHLETLIPSTLLRSGLLFTKGMKRLLLSENNLVQTYDINEGTMTVSRDTDTMHHEVLYGNNPDARKSFLTYFYTAEPPVKDLRGVTQTHITREEYKKSQKSKKFPELYGDR